MSLALLGVQASDLSPLSAEYAGPTKLACICHHDPSSPLEGENSENPFLNLLAIEGMEGILNKYIVSITKQVQAYLEVKHRELKAKGEQARECEHLKSHMVFKDINKNQSLGYESLLELVLSLKYKQYITEANLQEHMQNAIQLLSNQNNTTQVSGNFSVSSNLGESRKMLSQSYGYGNKKCFSSICPQPHNSPVPHWMVEWAERYHQGIYNVQKVMIWNYDCVGSKYIVVSFLYNSEYPQEQQRLSDCVKKVFGAQEIYSTLNPEPASSSTDSPNR